MSLQFPNLDATMANFENTNPSYNNPLGLAYTPWTVSQGANGQAPTGLLHFQMLLPVFKQEIILSRIMHSKVTHFQHVTAWAPGNAPGNTPQSTLNYVNTVASAK